MRPIKKIIFAILSIILILFITIQFIQPVRNTSGQVLQTDISNTYKIPPDISALIKNSCYDCHSNNTVYPWYSNIQPVGWLLEADIKNGKDKLNFSEFGSLSSRRQISKLRNIENRITDGTMPLPVYRLMHPSAGLTDEEKQFLSDWIQNTRDSIALKR
ncbi:MAG: heme-binding domain-containing protein [Ignavibacterium sp.]|jgi:uncharacterized membrane protein|nr:heme-binding domain-containing protein [Ignavibacterium sp.]